MTYSCDYQIRGSVGRRSRAYVIIFAICLLSNLALQYSVKAAEPTIELSLVSAWTSPDLGNLKMEEFVKVLNEKANHVKIKYKGGAEVVPPLEGLMYVKKGMIDLWHTTPAYYAGSIPAAMAAYNVVASQQELRESGFWEVYDQLHRSKAGVTALGQLWRGENFGLYLKKPITSIKDLKGLRIRSLPMYESFLRQLGASTVTLPQGEVYTALERGVVDGFCYPYGPGFLEKRWYEVVDYVIKPPIPYVTTGVLLANASKWDSLPDDAKKEVINLIIEMEPRIYSWYRDNAFKSIQKAVDEGHVKIISFNDADAKTFTEAATESMWSNIVKRSPEYGSKLKELGKKATKTER